MAPLTETQIIEVSIMVGYGTRTQKEICNWFNIKYPNPPITQSNDSETEKKHLESGHVKPVANAGRSK